MYKTNIYWEVIKAHFRCRQGPQDRGTLFLLRMTLYCPSGDCPLMLEVVDGGVGAIFVKISGIIKRMAVSFSSNFGPYPAQRSKPHGRAGTGGIESSSSLPDVVIIPRQRKQSILMCQSPRLSSDDNFQAPVSRPRLMRAQVTGSWQ